VALNSLAIATLGFIRVKTINPFVINVQGLLDPFAFDDFQTARVIGRQRNPKSDTKIIRVSSGNR